MAKVYNVKSGGEYGVGKSMARQSVELPNQGLVTAYFGAEIFNDYRERAEDVIYPYKGNVATGPYSHAEGRGCTALGNGAHAEGVCCEVLTGNGSHAEGILSIAEFDGAHAEGGRTRATGIASHSEGNYTIANAAYSHAQGTYNKEMNGGPTNVNLSSDLMVIGNGENENSRSNAFRVTFGGDTYGLSAFNSSGADYAEFFEWLDKNPKAEDRVGCFVTLDGKYIRIAHPNDFILGVISGQPCIIGNADEDWLGRWEHDAFGRFIKEETEDAVKSWREVTDPETGETTMEEYETGEVIKGWRYKANPDYDPSQPYVERKDRKEWDCVGLLGVLSVRDDGTCQVNGFCKVADGGIATVAESYIPGFTYRVIERVNEKVIKVIFR